jgi:hypothetical protein
VDAGRSFFHGANRSDAAVSPRRAITGEQNIADHGFFEVMKTAL